MTLEKSIQDDDQVFDKGDFKIVISTMYDDFYDTLEIDFVNNFLGKGFSIAEKGYSSGGSCSSGCCS